MVSAAAGIRPSGTHVERAGPSLYEVSIVHQRRDPEPNRFRYRSYMWMFDLDDPPDRVGARYRADDHLDIRAELAARNICADRIVVLTNLRVLGYVFNPISIYWCYGADGTLAARIAEVHNTYAGRHAYVIPGDDQDATVTKAMYVSPFYPVDGSYRIGISEPVGTLRVSVVLDRPDGHEFRAVMTGRRLEATAANRLRLFCKYPAAPLRGRALIQFQGLRLWRKGLEVQPR
ncbi:MAG TPA: DUF1365 domain-containing protein [Acidimicrobiales bacterium]|jgi:hypothetical protein|nr:DUF1365 domain-containing protein [Acidimicrobiales bacterium]